MFEEMCVGERVCVGIICVLMLVFITISVFERLQRACGGSESSASSAIGL